MAKKSAEVETEDNEVEEKLPELTKQEKQALFVAAEEAQKAVDAANETVAEAISACSECVKEIREKMGKGPFKRNGLILTAAKGKGGNYYLRGKNQKQVETI